MSVSYTGEIRDGSIVFDREHPPFPEGTRVRVQVEPVAPDDALTAAEEATISGTRGLLLKWARQAEAVAPPLPSDLAREHDHYAHGKPRTP